MMVQFVFFGQVDPHNAESLSDCISFRSPHSGQHCSPHPVSTPVAGGHPLPTGTGVPLMRALVHFRINKIIPFRMKHALPPSTNGGSWCRSRTLSGFIVC